MSRRRRVISLLMFGAALVTIIGLSEATLDPPQAYIDRFCLRDEGHQTCGFARLALCMKSMTGSDAECVREVAKDKNADRAGRHEH